MRRPCGRILIAGSGELIFFLTGLALPEKTPLVAKPDEVKMPPSQLKQLKASLRDTGVLGPQQSKKQKRQNAKTGAGAQNRNQRNAALQAIRDRFNPFEIRPTATRSKFETTTRDANSTKATGRRPGVTKSLGEERVRGLCGDRCMYRH